MMQITVSPIRILIAAAYSVFSLWVFLDYLQFFATLDSISTPKVFWAFFYAPFFVLFSVIFSWMIVGSIGAWIFSLTNLTGLGFFRRLNDSKTYNSDAETWKASGSCIILMFPFIVGVAGLVNKSSPLASSAMGYFFLYALSWGGALFFAITWGLKFWNSRKTFEETKSRDLRSEGGVVGLLDNWFQNFMLILVHVVACTGLVSVNFTEKMVIVMSTPLAAFGLLSFLFMGALIWFALGALFKGFISTLKQLS